MAVTSFQDLPLADRDREWDGDAAEGRDVDAFLNQIHVAVGKTEFDL